MASTGVGSEAASAESPLRRAWRAFGLWRRGRPFWAGVFTLASGTELLVLPKLPSPVTITVGIAGISGVLIGVLVLVMGIALWVAPHFRVFSGIATLLLSLTSFITTNFGGFLIGMLLGLVGGSLATAWVPEARHGEGGTPARPAAPPDAAPEDGATPGDGAPAGDAGSTAEPATAWFPFDESPDSGHEAGDGAPVPEEAPRADEPVGAGEAPDAAARADGTGAGGDAADGQGADGEPEAGGGEPDSSGEPEASGEPEERHGPRTALLVLALALAVPMFVGGTGSMRLAADTPPPVSDALPLMHARTIAMSSLSFDGIVEVSTPSGPLRTLKFSMASARMSDYTLRIPPVHGHAGASLDIPSLTLTSNVSFYTTRMSGLLFGLVPVTFTPDSPPPLVTPTTTFDDFDSTQVFVRSDNLNAGGLGLTPGTT